MSLDDCVIWTGSKRKGYGAKSIGGRLYGAHRLVWEDAHGKIPIGMCVLHRCDNPACVNIDHLFLGTHADNMRDARLKGRFPSGKSNAVDGTDIGAAHGTLRRYLVYHCRCKYCNVANTAKVQRHRRNLKLRARSREAVIGL